MILFALSKGYLLQCLDLYKEKLEGKPLVGD